MNTHGDYQGASLLIHSTIEKIEPLVHEDFEAAYIRQRDLTKPQGSLGQLEELAVKVAGIQKTDKPQIAHPEIHCYGADHGVACEEVSAYPQHVTAQMVSLITQGGAGVCALAQSYGVKVRLFDVGIKYAYDHNPSVAQLKLGPGTKNIAVEDAMDSNQCISAVEYGIKQVFASYNTSRLDAVGLGEIGIGNTTTASALIAGMLNLDPYTYVGFGSGIDLQRHHHKCEVVTQILQRHKDCFDAGRNPFYMLSACGGFEIAALVGTILGGASLRIPVILDGIVSCAAALIASELVPHLKSYLFAGHLSSEPLCKVALDKLQLDPICDFSMRLGEGSGAVMGIGVLKAACSALSRMKTFDESSVSRAII